MKLEGTVNSRGVVINMIMNMSLVNVGMGEGAPGGGASSGDGSGNATPPLSSGGGYSQLHRKINQTGDVPQAM